MYQPKSLSLHKNERNLQLRYNIRYHVPIQKHKPIDGRPKQVYKVLLNSLLGCETFPRLIKLKCDSASIHEGR